MLGIVAAPVAAARPDQVNVGGAAGLVAAVVQANVGEVNVFLLNNSLNNLLRNADIDVLNNVLNNNDVDVTITDIQILNDNTIVVTLLGGTILTFTR